MAIVFTANPVWPCEELPSATRKGKREMSALHRASLRSPKMKQKIIGAMFSRLFLKQKKNLRYSVLGMPSAIIYNL